MEMAKDMGDNHVMLEAADALQEAYAAKKNFQKAYKYLNVRDSLSDILSARTLYRLSVDREYIWKHRNKVISDSLEYLKKQAIQEAVYNENLAGEKRLRTTQNILWLIVFIAGCFFIGLLYSRHQNTRNEKLQLLRIKSLNKAVLANGLTPEIKLRIENWFTKTFENDGRALQSMHWKTLDAFMKEYGVRQKMLDHVDVGKEAVNKHMKKIYEAFDIETDQKERSDKKLEGTPTEELSRLLSDIITGPEETR